MSPVARPPRHEVLVFATRDELRAWFEANHATLSEAFIGFYRRGVPKTSVRYPEIVEEALCFGWIDGITFRIDEEVTANRYTPRRRGSNWSAVNVAKVAELVAAGRMHPAGIRAFEARSHARTGVYSYENSPRELPDEYAAELRRHADAWAFFERQRPSYRRAVTWWIVSARREETRRRRVEQLIEDSRNGRWIRQFQAPSARAQK